MNLIDWIENNKEKLLANSNSEQVLIGGVDLFPYEDEIKKLDIFKDREVVFLKERKFGIDNRSIICGDVDVQGGSGWTDKDRKMSWFYDHVHSDPKKLVHLYALRIYRNVNMFGMIYAFTEPDENYIRCLKRTEMIDKMLNNGMDKR